MQAGGPASLGSSGWTGEAANQPPSNIAIQLAPHLRRHRLELVKVGQLGTNRPCKLLQPAAHRRDMYTQVVSTATERRQTSWTANRQQLRATGRLHSLALCHQALAVPGPAQAGIATKNKSRLGAGSSSPKPCLRSATRRSQAPDMQSRQTDSNQQPLAAQSSP